MSDYLFVTDTIAPLADPADADAAGALGLAAALATAERRVAVLAQAAPEQLARQTGLARRLRPVTVSLANGDGSSETLEIPLFEGRATSSAAHLFVLGLPPATGERMAQLLGAAAQVLVNDGILKADFLVGWGERTAHALAALPDASSVLVIPGGRSGDDVAAGEDSLLAKAALATDAIVVPSPSAAAALANHAGMADRPSDQSLVVVRLGSDDPPHDPSNDPALAHHFSAASLAGKAECRKALARRLTLAVGPRTLLLLAPRLEPGAGIETLLAAIPQLAGLDVVLVLPTGSDRGLAERARVIAIGNPGRIALVEHGPQSHTLQRELLAAADAVALLDPDDRTARTAGLALRYGALPLAPDAGAFGDFLVDYDVASSTGNALMYAPLDAFELAGAIRRAIALRTDRQRWDALTINLLGAAPTWATAAARLHSLAVEAAKAAPTPVLA